MLSNLRVLPNEGVPVEPSDLLICCVGFERRSSEFAQSHRGTYDRGLAIAFTERKVLHYDENLKWYVDKNFLILPFDDALDGTVVISDALRLKPAPDGASVTRRVIVDVSSMSRPMIAALICWLDNLSAKSHLHVTFVYCPSKYVELGDQIYSMSYIGPVSPSFAGWVNDTKPRLVALVGLGGERGLALGAVEYLEATDVWAFLPKGVDAKFDKAATKANLELLDRIGKSRIVDYSPVDAFGTFCAIEALAYGTLQRERPILLPFGPKIFAVASLLVAQFYKPRIPVWRVSSEQSGEPVDRVASGEIAILNTVFG